MVENKQSQIMNKILNASEKELEQFLDEITDFDDLHNFMEITAKIDKAARKDKGFRDSFTKIYDDRTHFIYELLQNAEDAKATSVYFKLNADSLAFSHNGTDIFDLNDIKGITGWGNSTKEKDTGTKIGKFGIGFKSVYAYTDEPYIYSKDFNFKIKDFFVPEKIPAKENFEDSQTLFILPFNYKNKSAVRAYEEIKKGLNEIIPETLLFLSRIRKLEWEIDGDIYCLEKEQNEHTFLIYKNKSLVARYLRFDDTAQYYDTEKECYRSLPISLAYKLDLIEDKIIPTDNLNNVYTFFKVKNEYAKLYYLINALFELTQSRDRLISGSETNQEILSQIADLQSKSMEYLQNNNYLTTEFLGIMPSSKDQLPEMYEVFHTKLVDLFKTEAYTPTINGEFCSADALFKGASMYRNGPHISEFITDENLADMLKVETNNLGYGYDIEPPLWVKNTLQNTRADNFLQDLDINSFGIDEFYNWFKGYSDNKRTIWQKIIEKKNFNDLARLYRMLEQYFDENKNGYYDGRLDDFALIHCIDGKLYCLDDNIYMMPDEDINKNILNLYHFIDPQSFGTSQQRDKIKHLFSSYFSIDEFSEKSVCESMLKNYEEENKTVEDISITQHIEDIKLLLKHYDNNKWNFQDKLRGLQFILTSDNKYVSIDEVYSDIRYGNKYDLMVEAKDVLGLSEINIVYKDKLGSKQVEKFISILEDLGIHKLLWVEEADCWDNPRRNDLSSKYNCRWDTQINRDAQIYQLPAIIENIRNNKKLSELIWRSVLEVDTEEFSVEAYYRANRQDPGKSVPSQYVCTLSEKGWILGKDGCLHKPADVTFDDLPDNWKRPKEYYGHPILKAIGFGKNSQKIRDEQKQKDQFAQTLGYKNAQDAEEAKKLWEEAQKAGITPAEMLNFIQCKQDKNNKSFLEAIPKNPERRQEKVAEEYENAEEQTYEQRMRTVKTSGGTIRPEISQYLKDMYTDEDGEMYCQMCHNHESIHKLPFKKRNKEYYFESTQIFKQMPKEDKRQFLALCPNCAAEYEEWVRKDDKMVKLIHNMIAERAYVKGEDPVILNFSIDGVPHSLYFRGTHYLDLRTVVCPEADKDISQSLWISLENDNVPLSIGDTVRATDKKEGVVKEIIKDKDGDKAQIEYPNDTTEIYQIDFLEKKIR